MATCATEWGPSIFTPVSYGYSDYWPSATGSPAEVRVYFPSRYTSSPLHAAILQDCGKFPLVVFLHGNCPAQPDHHRKWIYTPSMLARSGYVVAVPSLPGIEAGTIPIPGGTSDAILVHDIMDWIRTGWVHRALVAAGTAIVGHSYGALLGAAVAYAEPINAYVSFSGGWGEVAPADLNPFLFSLLGCPALYMWGSGDDYDAAAVTAGSPSIWDGTTPPKHRLVFTDANHWDYLPDGAVPCTDPGPCSDVEALAGDFATSFIAKYLPPLTEGASLGTIPDSLIPPHRTPSDYDPDFLSDYMPGMKSLPLSTPCAATHVWQLAGHSPVTDTL